MALSVTGLQIGDWVYVPMAKHTARIDSVLSKEEARCDVCVVIDFMGQGFLAHYKEKDITPIPLTAEILEKNGFVKHDKIHPYYMDYYHERDGFIIFNSRTWHGHILESVHKLQHALRLCGLNELADNLIIE